MLDSISAFYSSLAICTEELAWSFRHRSSCSDDSERPISETRGPHSSNSSPDNQHVGRLSRATQHRAEFEETEEGEKGVLGEVSTLTKSLKTRRAFEPKLEYTFPVNG